MRTNPHLNSEVDAREATEGAFLQAGVVSTAPTDQSGAQHHVAIQEATTPVDAPVPVLPSVHGDYYLPPQGAPVVMAPTSRGGFVVTNALVPSTDTPVINPGERIISHPASQAAMRFEKDGTLKIGGDPNIVINNGSKGVIHDISTTTDSDGHVTSVDVQRRSDILI